MMKNITAASLLLVAGIALAGCSSADVSVVPETSDTATTAPETSDVTLVGPVVADVNDLAGTTVELSTEQTLDINVGDTAVTSWVGESSDTNVVVFVVGYEDDSAIYNPGFYGVGSGEATVTLTNDDSSIAPVEFTVVVK